MRPYSVFAGIVLGLALLLGLLCGKAWGDCDHEDAPCCTFLGIPYCKGDFWCYRGQYSPSGGICRPDDRAQGERSRAEAPTCSDDDEDADCGRNGQRCDHDRFGCKGDLVWCERDGMRVCV